MFGQNITFFFIYSPNAFCILIMFRILGAGNTIINGTDTVSALK